MTECQRIPSDRLRSDQGSNTTFGTMMDMLRSDVNFGSLGNRSTTSNNPAYLADGARVGGSAAGIHDPVVDDHLEIREDLGELEDAVRIVDLENDDVAC